MRTAWNIVSFLAVVHLLALLMFCAWLWQSERLSVERLGELKSMLATTIPESEAAAEQAAREAEAQRRQTDEAARRRDPGVPSAMGVADLTRRREAEQRALRRLEDVRRQLLRQITAAEGQLAERREELEARREEIESGLAQRQGRLAEDQLTKAVKLLESLPPKQGKQKIVELTETGRTDEAVVYLDSMNRRAAGKILAEFRTPQENKLATELLERIRTLGLPDGETGASQDAADADSVASTG